jgi:hypothetical protein
MHIIISRIKRLTSLERVAQEEEASNDVGDYDNRTDICEETKLSSQRIVGSRLAHRVRNLRNLCKRSNQSTL